MIDISVKRRRCCTLAVEITAEPDIARARITINIQHSTAHEPDVIPKHRDLAALLSCADARRIQFPADQYRAAAGLLAFVRCDITCDSIAAFSIDDNFAVLLRHGRRLQFAIGLDQAVHNAVACRRCQGDRATGGRNRAFVLDQLFLHGIADCKIHQAIAIQIHHKGISRGELHFAETRGDRAIVDNIRRNKPDQTRLPCRNAAVVDDGSRGITGLIKSQGAVRHKGLIADARRRGDQAVYIHVRSGAEHNAARINEDDVSIGAQMPEDLAGVDVMDAVERDG